MSSAGIYVRLSKDREAQTSTERQEADAREYATRMGLEVVEVYADTDRSAYLAGVKRPGLDSALAALEAGTITTLVVWKLDRLSRRGMGQVGQVLDRLETTGGRIVSVMEGVDTSTSHGRIIVALLSEMARSESDNTGTRIRSAKAYARQRGLWAGGRPPFGVLRTEAGVLAPDPVEAPVLLDVIQGVEGGETLSAMARRLRDQGVATRKGGAWSARVLGGILRSPATAGLLPAYQDKKAPARDPETREVVACGVGVITPTRWKALVATLDSRTASAANGRPIAAKRRGLLTGLARCAECGGPLHMGGGSDVRPARYRCADGSAAAGVCPGVSIAATPLEDWVAKMVLTKLAALDPEDPLLGAVAERWLARFSPQETRARGELLERVADMESALADLEEGRYLRGEFASPEGLARYADLHGRMSGLLAAKRRELGDLPPLRPDLGPLLDLEQSTTAWALASAQDRRAILDLALDGVEVARVGKEGRRGQRPDERATLIWAKE